MDETTQAQVLALDAKIKAENAKEKPNKALITELFKEIDELSGGSLRPYRVLTSETPLDLAPGVILNKAGDLTIPVLDSGLEEIDSLLGWKEDREETEDNSGPLASEMASLFLRLFSWCVSSKDPSVIGRKLLVVHYMLCPGSYEGKSMAEVASEYGDTRQNFNQWAAVLRDRFGIKSRLGRSLEACENMRRGQLDQWQRRRRKSPPLLTGRVSDSEAPVERSGQ